LKTNVRKKHVTDKKRTQSKMISRNQKNDTYTQPCLLDSGLKEEREEGGVKPDKEKNTA